jgi:hypothetical protein
VFENRLLRRIFEQKRYMTGEWKILHNKELRNVYSSPRIIRIMKSRRMRLAEHVARIVAKWNAYSLLVRKLEVKRAKHR